MMRALILFLLLPFWVLADGPIHTIREVDVRGYYLTLEDNSTWCISWWNAWNSWHWKQGERVQILQDEETQLFNLDQPEKRARIFAALCPSLEKVKNRHFIAEILENGEVIKLDNGFSLRAAWPNNEEIQKEVKRWRVGDELLLNAWYETGGGGFIAYLLENITRFSEVEVPVRFNETQGAYTAHKIEEIGWDSITLDDGSCWEHSHTEYFLTTFMWNKGDPVMVFLKQRENLKDYILINCNARPRQGYFVKVREAPAAP